MKIGGSAGWPLDLQDSRKMIEDHGAPNPKF